MQTKSSVARRTSRLAATALPVLLFATAPLAARKFLDDDPLRQEPKPRDASQALSRKISDYYDFAVQNFSRRGEYHTPGHIYPARGVDTLGEPMAGVWYTPRHYYRRMSLAELAEGAGNQMAPSLDGPWKVVKAKTEGITPGFEFVDSAGHRYMIKFDPLDYPEIASSADVLVSKFFYALGYHVPQNYIVYFPQGQLTLRGDVKMVTAVGKTRRMTVRDLVDVMMNVPRNHEGQFRGAASLYLHGKPLGPFKYYGTRRDDPNDVVPHEHRRELRGLSIFCAWLGHDDSRAINTQDMLVEEGGVSYIRHHLIDFGSTLGSASTGPNSPRSGFEYIVDWDAGFRQLLTLGFAPPDWASAKYPKYRSVGRFESRKFRAEEWVPEYPNPSFRNRLPDDEFWAAKQVMAFTDEEIAAIVKTGQYSDPGAEQWITRCLIERRDKIGRAFLERVLPLDKFAVRGGRLEFEDLGLKHQLVAARQYSVQWSVFDNERETKTTISEAASLIVPEGEVGEGGYLAADIHRGDPQKSLTVYLLRKPGDWQVVGIERRWNPEDLKPP